MEGSRNRRGFPFQISMPAATGYPAAQLADPLGHGSHRTERTPGPRLIKYHNNEPNQQGGQHQAVKPEAELRRPVRNGTCCIGPAPGNPERPEQLDGFPQRIRARADQPCLKQHIPEHGQEKGQEAIAEPFGIHPGWRRPVPGAFQIPAQLHAQLAAPAQVVAEPFVAAENCQSQRQKKINHPQPREQDVEEAQNKIEHGPEPEIVIPMLLPLHRPSVLSSSVIQPAGQAFAHKPHPTQTAGLMSAQHPSGIPAASLGHTTAHVPQATQTA